MSTGTVPAGTIADASSMTNADEARAALTQGTESRFAPLPSDQGAEEAADAGAEQAGSDAAADQTTDESTASQTEASDYSEDALAAQASRYEKTLGVKFNLSNPAERALLQEVIARGEALNRQTSTAADEAAETSVDETQETAQPVLQPSATVAEYLQQADTYAEQSIVPEVAQAFAAEFVESLWPGESKKLTAESSRKLTKALTKFGTLMMRQMFPEVATSVHDVMTRNYPLLTSIHAGAVQEQAVSNLLDRSDKAGAKLYSDLEALTESGDLRRVMREYGIAEMQFRDDRGKPLDKVKNAERQIERAIKLARAEKGNPALVNKALETGRKLATEGASRSTAGRLAAGESKGAFTAPSDVETVVQSMKRAAHSEGRFSELVKGIGRGK